jgi:Transposase protein
MNSENAPIEGRPLSSIHFDTSSLSRIVQGSAKVGHDHTYTDSLRKNKKRKGSQLPPTKVKLQKLDSEDKPAWEGWSEANRKQLQEIEFWKRSSDENKRLHQMAIKQVQKLEAELKNREAKQYTREEMLEEFQNMSGRLLTKKQLHVLVNGLERTNWDPEDISRAFALRYFSMSAYNYMKSLGYPLPELSTLRKYAATFKIRGKYT